MRSAKHRTIEPRFACTDRPTQRLLAIDRMSERTPDWINWRVATNASARPCVAGVISQLDNERERSKHTKEQQPMTHYPITYDRAHPGTRAKIVFTDESDAYQRTVDVLTSARKGLCTAACIVLNEALANLRKGHL